MYLIRPFCNDCIDPLLFSMFFWLGYCNSAVNPMIYALFSKDFRFAFKRLLCCKGSQFGRPTSRRGSDLSQLKTGGRTPSISPSANANSLEDNSDPIETSESRWRSFALSVSSTSSAGGGRSSSSARGPVYDICHPLVMETPSYGSGNHHLHHLHNNNSTSNNHNHAVAAAGLGLCGSNHLSVNASQTITINSIGSKYADDLVLHNRHNLWWSYFSLNLLSFCNKPPRSSHKAKPFGQ